MENDKEYDWHQLDTSHKNLLAEGEIIKYIFPDKELCVTMNNGEYFSFQAKCPHAGAKLEQGYFSEKCNLVCPLHQYEFDIRNGRNVSGEGFHLITYPVKRDEFGFWVGIPKPKR